MSIVSIPKTNEENSNYPCWIPVVNPEGERIRPAVRCKCGSYCSIQLHHIHEDGTVTASFYHQKADGQKEPHIGCEWHVYLKFEDYDWGEFKPEKSRNR